MYEIGHVPGNTAANSNANNLLISPEWLPDGKHVSFVYRDTLYVVPAEMAELR